MATSAVVADVAPIKNNPRCSQAASGLFEQEQESHIGPSSLIEMSASIQLVEPLSTLRGVRRVLRLKARTSVPNKAWFNIFDHRQLFEH